MGLVTCRPRGLPTDSAEEPKKGRGLLATTEPLEYNLEDLLRQCDPEKMKLSKDDEAWVNSPPVGNEVL